jgi:carboxymethylenebutenolidase
LATDIKAAVLRLYGEADTGILVPQVEAPAAAGKIAEVKIYPGAPHGFHADYRPSYRQEAAAAGWKQMQAWLTEDHVLS